MPISRGYTPTQVFAGYGSAPEEVTPTDPWSTNFIIRGPAGANVGMKYAYKFNSSSSWEYAESSSWEMVNRTTSAPTFLLMEGGNPSENGFYDIGITLHFENVPSGYVTPPDTTYSININPQYINVKVPQSGVEALYTTQGIDTPWGSWCKPYGMTSWTQIVDNNETMIGDNSLLYVINAVLTVRHNDTFTDYSFGNSTEEARPKVIRKNSDNTFTYLPVFDSVISGVSGNYAQIIRSGVTTPIRFIDNGAPCNGFGLTEPAYVQDGDTLELANISIRMAWYNCDNEEYSSDLGSTDQIRTYIWSEGGAEWSETT